jgi:hypothetical protein
LPILRRVGRKTTHHYSRFGDTHGGDEWNASTKQDHDARENGSLISAGEPL